MTEKKALSDEKKRLSYTHISTYLKCPRQYKFKYIDKIKVPKSGTLFQSIVMHDTIAQNYSQKINTKKDLSVNKLKEIYTSDYDETLKRENIDFNGKDPETIKAQALGLLEVYHKVIAPQVQPLYVEKWFTVSLGDDFPYVFSGRWDVIDENGIIIDNKAAGKTPSQKDIDKDLQLTGYALAYRLMFSEIEKELRIDAMIKLKTPKAVQIVTKRDNDDCQWFLGLVENIAFAIDREAFYPNPNGWHCGEDYCDYWDRCRSKNKEVIDDIF